MCIGIAITTRFHRRITPCRQFINQRRKGEVVPAFDGADTHGPLIDEVIKYQTDHGNFAQPPAIAAVTSDDVPPATPTKRRNSRAREPKQ